MIPETRKLGIEKDKDGNVYHVYENVPIFDEHIDDDGVRYDFNLLSKVAANNNLRIADTGDYVPIVEWHTDPKGDTPDTDPPLCGFAGPFIVAKFGKEKPRACIYAKRWRILDEKHETAKRRPRRSVEIWPEESPDKRFIDPIALLAAETPRRDLGIVQYSREGKKHRYEMATVPGGSNTFIPRTVGDDKDRVANEPDRNAKQQGLFGDEQLGLFGDTYKPGKYSDKDLEELTGKKKEVNPKEKQDTFFHGMDDEPGQGKLFETDKKLNSKIDGDEPKEETVNIDQEKMAQFANMALAEGGPIEQMIDQKISEKMIGVGEEEVVPDELEGDLEGEDPLLDSPGPGSGALTRPDEPTDMTGGIGDPTEAPVDPADAPAAAEDEDLLDDDQEKQFGSALANRFAQRYGLMSTIGGMAGLEDGEEDEPDQNFKLGGTFKMPGSDSGADQNAKSGGTFDMDGARQYRNALDEADRNSLDRYMKEDCDDEEIKKKYSKLLDECDPAESNSKCGGNMSNQYSKKAAQYKKQLTDTQKQLSNQKKQYRKLQEDLAEAKDELTAARAREVHQYKKATLIEKQEAGIVLDIDDELDYCDPMNKEDFDRYADRLDSTRPRVPLGSVGGNFEQAMAKESAEIDKVTDKYSEAAFQYCKRRAAAGQDAPYAKVLAYMKGNKTTEYQDS